MTFYLVSIRTLATQARYQRGGELLYVYTGQLKAIGLNSSHFVSNVTIWFRPRDI